MQDGEGSARSAPASGEGSRRTARILLVEDHADTAELTKIMLTRAGYEIVVARTRAEALAIVANDRFDLLISDVALPDGDGRRLLGEMRERGGPKRAIAVSGFGTEDAVKASRNAGFAEHLVKPFDKQQLLDAIAALLASAATEPK